MNAPRTPDVLTLGGSVVISGSAAKAAMWAVLVAKRERQRSGLPHSKALDDIGTALLAAMGQRDVPEPVPESSYEQQPDVSIEHAAQILGLSRRQTRRMATELGGMIIAGRWMLDRQSIIERKEYRDSHTPI